MHVLKSARTVDYVIALTLYPWIVESAPDQVSVNLRALL